MAEALDRLSATFRDVREHVRLMATIARRRPAIEAEARQLGLDAANRVIVVNGDVTTSVRRCDLATDAARRANFSQSTRDQLVDWLAAVDHPTPVGHVRVLLVTGHDSVFADVRVDGG
jgi:hypothetical protein